MGSWKWSQASTHWYCAASDFPLQTSHFRLRLPFPLPLRTSDFTLPHFRLQTSDFKLSSERHSKADLRLSTRRDRIADAAERRQRRLAVGLAGKRAQLGDAEIGAVEDVEHFDAKLDLRRCSERCPSAVLAEGEVERAQVGSDEIAATGVAERACRLENKRRRIEPLCRRSIDRLVGVVAWRVTGAVLTDSRARETGSIATANGSRSRTQSAAGRSASSRCPTPASLRRARGPLARRFARTEDPN